MTTKTYRMSDSVLQRFVQIVQEAFLTGTDVSDHLRMVQVQEDPNDSTALVLTEQYVDTVRKQHESMLKFAEEQAAAKVAVAPQQSILVDVWSKGD